MQSSEKCNFHGCENAPSRRYWGRADGQPDPCCQTHYDWLRHNNDVLLKPPPANDTMKRIYELTLQLMNAYHKANREALRAKGIDA